MLTCLFAVVGRDASNGRSARWASDSSCERCCPPVQAGQAMPDWNGINPATLTKVR